MLDKLSIEIKSTTMQFYMFTPGKPLVTSFCLNLIGISIFSAYSTNKKIRLERDDKHGMVML